MANELRVLLLEDNLLDADRIARALRDWGLEPELSRVEIRADFRAALKRGEIDVIIADYSLSSFNGLEALSIASAVKPEIPFIFVAEAMGEDLAVGTLKNGAADYVLKDRLQRLPAAVERALKEAAQRALRGRVEEAARHVQERYHLLFETLSEGFCIIEMIFDAEDHPVDYRFLEVNPAFEAQTGLRDVQGKRMSELAPVHETHWFEMYGKVARTGEPVHFVSEARALKRWFDVSAYRLGGADSRKVAVLLSDVTERKRLEDSLNAQNQELRRTEGALRESRNFLNSIINAIADPVYVKDSGRRFVLVNESLARLLGRPRAEFIGKSAADIFSGHAMEALLAQDDRVLRTGKIDAVEVLVKDAAGRERIVSAIKTLHVGAGGERLLVVCLRDVTEARAGEQVALRAREEWERTFNAVPDLIAVLDARHRIRRVNKAMAERLGLSREACAGRPCHEVVHGASHPKGDCPHAFTCADGKEHFTEVHEERLGGDFQISTTPVFDDRGRVSGSVHVARDITAAKKAEAGLREAAQLRTDLISLINHEYNNGLANMKIAMSLLREAEPGELDETKRFAYEVMDATLEKLKSYTANFLNLHRLESGTFELVVQPNPIRPVLSGVMATQRPTAEAKKQRLTMLYGFPDDVPVLVRADPDCLSLIVVNLVSNAVKYTPEGGRISIQATPEKGPPPRVRVAVSDTGIGLSAPDRARILSGPFRTEEGKRAAKGFGVGLTLVRKLLEKHGSRLEIDSEPGKGSRFSFCLPVWAEEPASKARSTRA